MSTSADTAQIIDLNAYRQQHQQESQPAQDANGVPAYVWCPMWVLIPNPALTPQS